MKQQIIDLWKLSFGDPDEFIQIFFDRVYKDENTFVIEQNGKVVSALQILPYEMTYCGTTIPAGYICGVCTLPAEKGKGLMTQLMLTALEEMRNRNYALAILIPATPWLFDFYRKFEFANAFDYATEAIYRQNPATEQRNKTANKSESGFRIVSHNAISTESIYAYYHLKQRARDCSIQHSMHQFDTIRLDWMLGKGEIWVALFDEKPAGLAFTMVSANESVSFREIMADNPEIKKTLVQFVLNQYQLPKAELRIPVAGSDLCDSVGDLRSAPTVDSLGDVRPHVSTLYGMARIIDKELMIGLYRSMLEGQDSSMTDLQNASLASLTQILLKYEQRRAYMNLMMD